MITCLADSDLFIGHSTSYARLAKILDVPWVRIQDNGTRKPSEKEAYRQMKSKW